MNEIVIIFCVVIASVISALLFLIYERLGDKNNNNNNDSNWMNLLGYSFFFLFVYSIIGGIFLLIDILI